MGVEGRGSFSYTKPKAEGSPKVSACAAREVELGWKSGCGVGHFWLAFESVSHGREV